MRSVLKPGPRPLATFELKPRIVKQADGAASALAFVAAGFGVAVVGEPLQKIAAKDVIFRDLAPEEGAWVPPGSRTEYPLPLFLNSSMCWLKPVPAKTQGR